MKKLQTMFKLWLNSEDVEGVFGDGKWRLLKAIEKEGSLQAASKSLRMSYRKAWGDLKKAGEGLNISLVEKRRGGKAGGQTTLTADGKKWLRAYEKFRRDIEKAVDKSFKRHFREPSK